MSGDEIPRLARHDDATRAVTSDGAEPSEPAAAPADGGAPADTFLIVGIGASAGGLEALEAFFEHVPPEPGMAFVVVQHLAPDHPSIMPELLGRRTKMPVQLAEDRARVARDSVYVIPPNSSLAIHGGVLSVKSPLDRRCPPIDTFFRSLAEDQGPNAIGIVLSGTGADGSLGVRAIKEHGGMAIAQDAETARYDSMPRSAIAVGLVDHVLPPARMPQKLLDYMMYPAQTGTGAEAQEPREEDEGEALRNICSLLQRRTGHDFSHYKPATLVRRIRRRMQVVQVAGLEPYVERLRGETDEVDALFRDLLIGVTQFFRDPEAFAALEAAVVPRLLRGKGPGDQVRVWVPGCATGEEAYSIAILIREQLSKMDVAPQVKILATDIDERALAVARLGRYSGSVAEHVTPQRLERFFVKQDGMYQVSKELREMCIFSVHNVISDPPFSRLDLLSCRNLLIYLDGDVQRRLTPLFHYALRPGGHLFLGPSESLAVPDLFRTIDKTNRLFVRNDAVTAPPVQLPFLGGARGARGLGDGAPRAQPSREQGLARHFDRALLAGFGPAAVVINERAEVVYTSGRTGKYLELAQGMMNLNLVDLARRTLRPDLYTAIHKAVTGGLEIIHERVPLEVNGKAEWIDLIVRPLPELEAPSKLFLVVFRDAQLPGEDSAGAAAAARELDPLARVLEAELRSTKEHLQTTIEELETSNEELKSANEELQSTNEELQTSKEELQSINEELQTVNLELSRKVDELDRANSDLQNLFASTQIATVFLDRELRIKKFSAAATDVFRIIDADVGRPITDIAGAYMDGNLVEDATEVLSTLRPKERQIFRDDVGLRYIRRIRPYQSTGHVIDGVVVTLVDVTELTKAQERAAGLAAIVASSEDAIVGISLDGAITSWNRGAERLYGRAASEAVGRQASSLGSPMSDLAPYLRRIRAGEDVPPFEAVCSREGTSPSQILVAAFPVRDESGKVVATASIGRDVTEAKVHVRSLEEAALLSALPARGK